MLKDKTTNEEKLTRCGACGDWQQNPDFYLQKEQDEAELIYCGCEEERETRYVTKDMAIDAGDLSLEGQRM